jgi:O-antigen/teichoic acid export membrane protein
VVAAISDNAGNDCVRLTAVSTTDRILPAVISRRLRPVAEKIDNILFSRDNAAVAQRITVFAFLVRVVSAAIALISQVILARVMGMFEYGIFVLVWTAMVIAGNITCFGFQVSVIRFVPQYREQGDFERLRGVIYSSRMIVFMISTVLAVAGLALIRVFAEHIPVYYIAPFLLGTVLLPMIAMGDYLAGLSRSQGWAMLSLLPVYIVRPVLILVFVLGAIWAGYAPTAINALIASIIACYVATLSALVQALRFTPSEHKIGPRKLEIKTWVAVSLPIFLVEGFYFTMTNADVLMVGAYMQPEQVAIYFAAVKILALVHFVNFAVRAGAAQRFSTLLHSADKTHLSLFARQTVQWMFWPSLMMAILMVALGEDLLRLFGGDFVDGHKLMAILAFGIVVRAAVGPCESVLTMTGQERICAVAYGVALAVNLTLNVILIPVYGLIGAAIATALAMFVEAIMLSTIVKRRVGFTMFVLSPLFSSSAKV